MKTRLFVQKIGEIINESLRKYLEEETGSDELFNEFRNDFTFQLKTKSYVEEEDPILELLGNYNCDSIKLNMISLYKKPIFSRDKVYFGECDTEPLCINKSTLEIELQYEEDLFEPIAQNSGAFFEAIYESLLFSTHVLLMEDDFEKVNKIATLKALEIATSAGGKKYVDFYSRFFGVST